MNLKLEAEESAMRIAPMCAKEMPSPSPSTVPLAHRMGEGPGVRAMASDERAGARSRLPVPQSAFHNPHLQARFVQFTKFCMVGGSGVVVDMGILYLLADPSRLALNITLSKICAAEVAMINNFIWNELWTFRQSPSPGGEGGPEYQRTIDGEARAGARVGQISALNSQPTTLHRRGSVFRRFLLFNAICGIGIGLAVLLLHLFHTWLAWNIYLSNLFAIILVTCWNFGMNARFNWRIAKTNRHKLR